MFDIYFVTGTDDRWKYPKAVTAAGLKYQFRVIQHGDSDLNPQTTADPDLVRAIAAFLTAYAANADVTAGDEWEDLGQKERPLSDYMAEWETTPEANRDPPAVAVRKSGKALAYMLVEPWDGVGGPWPYADSCTYAFFTDRDIGPELEAYLRGHPDASRWNFGSVTMPAKAAEHYPIPVRREGAVVPRRQLHTVGYVVAALILALLALAFWNPNHWRTQNPVNFWEFIAAICGFSAFQLVREIPGLDVVLSPEGIRKGAGTRYTFIAWKDARLDFRGSTVVVRSGKDAIVLRHSLYKPGEFYRFFRVIAQDIVDGGLRRAVQAVNLTTPAYKLSVDDMKAFFKYRGEGRRARLPYIGPYTICALMLTPFFAFIIRHSSWRDSLPQALHPAPKYLAVALACVFAVTGACFGVEWALRRRALWRALMSSWEFHQDFTLSISEAGVASRTAGYEHFRYWDELHCVVDSPRLILVFGRKGIKNIVPKRIFASPEDAIVFFNTALTLKRAFVS